MKDAGTDIDVIDRLLRSSDRGSLVEDMADLYAHDAVSVHGPEHGGRVQGLDALTRRMKARRASAHGDKIFADGPYVLDEDGRRRRFAFVFERALRQPSDAPIERMSQLVLFEARDDMIVREEVFLQPLPAVEELA